MIASVPVLLLGVVVMSAIGSLAGYLLEPGRSVTRDTAESAAQPAAAASSDSQSPRLAA